MQNNGNQSWISIGRPDAEAETPVLWPPDPKNWLTGKDPDAGKDWRQKEKRTTEGWDHGMASPTPWTWVWASSEGWWWTGKPGVLQSMGSQRVGHDWATELNWTDRKISFTQRGNTLMKQVFQKYLKVMTNPLSLSQRIHLEFIRWNIF